jgi:hypothetical protein
MSSLLDGQIGVDGAMSDVASTIIKSAHPIPPSVVQPTDIVAEISPSHQVKKSSHLPPSPKMKISQQTISPSPSVLLNSNETAKRDAACRQFNVPKSPINVAAFEQLLKTHPDRNLVQELIHDLTQGVRIGYDGPRDKFRPCPNLKIDPSHESFVDDDIKKEVDAGRRIGPFDSPPFENLIVSPIGVVTKKFSAKLRLIHHLSWPRHYGEDSDSINEHISAEDRETKLSSFDDAVNMLASIPKSKSHLVQLLKLDVRSAYRLVFVHPDDWHCVGMQWRGKYYFDPFLVFGLSSACRHWERVATAIHWIAEHKLGIKLMIHYIDDYLVISIGAELAEAQLSAVLKLFKMLGVPLAEDKKEGPTNKLTFLGIQIDTLTMTISIDPVRLTHIQSTLSDWLKLSQASIKQVESLVGTLQFCCRVIRCGRTFLRRLINWKTHLSHRHGITNNAHKRMHNLTDSVKKDILWWATYMKEFNGTMSIYPTKWCEDSDMRIATDACQQGYGAVFGNKWFAGTWSAEDEVLAKRLKRDSMPWKELHTLVRAAATWGNEWKGKNIKFHLDCEPMVHAVEKGGSRSPEIMSLIRTLSYIAVRSGFYYTVSHIAGRLNVGPDLLSRNRVSVFLAQFPHSNRSPVIPSTLPCHTW